MLAFDKAELIQYLRRSLRRTIVRLTLVTSWQISNHVVKAQPIALTSGDPANSLQSNYIAAQK